MARIKVKEHEKLTNANIQKVIELLNPVEGKPITKKDACEILNISYNTSRLSAIIEAYKTRTEYENQRKAQNKGKPASQEEIQLIASSFLLGECVADISRSIFRSATFVKNIIDKIGVPTKVPKEQGIALLPEESIAESFEEGQAAWSAKHNGLCEIISEMKDEKYERAYYSKCYKIYVFEPMEEVSDAFPNIKKGGYYAFALAYDLGSLKHLDPYGVKL